MIPMLSGAIARKKYFIIHAPFFWNRRKYMFMRKLNLSRIILNRTKNNLHSMVKSLNFENFPIVFKHKLFILIDLTE